MHHDVHCATLYTIQYTIQYTKQCIIHYTCIVDLNESLIASANMSEIHSIHL